MGVYTHVFGNPYFFAMLGAINPIEHQWLLRITLSNSLLGEPILVILQHMLGYS